MTKDKKLKMTTQQYIATCGQLCPVCGVDDSAYIGGTCIDDDGSVVQEVMCNACGAEWYEYYELASYAMKVNEEDADG